MVGPAIFDAFLTTNLWYMKQWYLSYYQEDTKLYQLGEEFPSSFAYIPWGHHIAIISKCKSVDERQQIIPTNQWAGVDRERNN